MRLRLGPSPPPFLLLLLILALALAPVLVSSAGIRLPNPPLRRDSPGSSSSIFPVLRWLRDRAVELAFDRPNRTIGKYARPDYGGLTRQYRDDVVMRFYLSTADEEKAFASAADQLLLDIWAFTSNYVDIRMHKDDIPRLLSLLPLSLHQSLLTVVHDVPGAVYATYPSASRAPVAASWSVDSSQLDRLAQHPPTHNGASDVFFQDYQPLSVIALWMDLLQGLFPTFVERLSIGKSYEGRNIPALRLSKRHDDRSNTRRANQTILVTGGLHGREWISISTVNYLAWSFATLDGKDPMVTHLLHHFDFVFIPVVNPDGYDYTWQTDRLWRKSRQRTRLRICPGLDLDRTFGYGWDAFTGQNDPCSESYAGDQPFEAVETAQLARWARNHTDGMSLAAYIDLQSYSQQVLYPYAYTCAANPPNLENLEELAAGLAKAIRLNSGQLYRVTAACQGAVPATPPASAGPTRLEPAGGSAIDWFFHELDAKFSYQIKLGDTGSYGFLLPSSEIIPTGEELLSAVKYLGDYLLGNNGIERLVLQE